MVIAGKTFKFAIDLSFSGDEGEVTEWDVTGQTLTRNFTSNSTNYTSMVVADPAEDFNYDSNTVWNYAEGYKWYNEAYRTVTFDSNASDVTGDWATFFEENAIEVIPYLASSADLVAVADAIRTKGGTSANLTFPSGFVSAIENISGGDNSMVFGYANGRIIQHPGTTDLMEYASYYYSNYFFRPYKANKVSLSNYDLSTCSQWRILVKFRPKVDAATKSSVFFGSSSNFFHIPSMELNTDYLWAGYSTSGSSWDYYHDIDFQYSANTWYYAVSDWNNTDNIFALTVYNNAGTYINQITATISTPVYSHSFDIYFGGIANSYNHMCTECDIDAAKCFIELDNTVVWGAKTAITTNMGHFPVVQ